MTEHTDSEHTDSEHTGSEHTGSEHADSTTAPQQGAQHRAADPGDLVVTRSEERLRVDVDRRPYERVRVRRTVVTETVQVQVQVRREELHVEREPITDPTGAVDVSAAGGTSSGGVLEVVLHEERPVVGVQVVPVERVRLLTEVVGEEQQVRGEVRSERIDLEGVEGVGGVPAAAPGTGRP